MKENPQFPAPEHVLPSGQRLWATTAIEEWARANGREPHDPG